MPRSSSPVALDRHDVLVDGRERCDGARAQQVALDRERRVQRGEVAEHAQLCVAEWIHRVEAQVVDATERRSSKVRGHRAELRAIQHRELGTGEAERRRAVDAAGAGAQQQRVRRHGGGCGLLGARCFASRPDDAGAEGSWAAAGVAAARRGALRSRA